MNSTGAILLIASLCIFGGLTGFFGARWWGRRRYREGWEAGVRAEQENWLTVAADLCNDRNPHARAMAYRLVDLGVRGWDCEEELREAIERLAMVGVKVVPKRKP